MSNDQPQNTAGQGQQPARRLGRGLEALLGQPGAAAGGEVKVQEAGARPAPTPGLQKVPISKIDTNPFQPRRTFDSAEIKQLGESLQAHGMINPIVVRLVEGRYQLIAGERRLKAAQGIGWNTVPARVVEATDRQVAEVAIVENLQRTDLNPLEKAAAFREYLQKYNCKQDELAGRIGVDRSTIANLIRLLELPAVVQEAVRTNVISAGHARALLPLGEEADQVKVCGRIKAEGLSVRAVEQLVREMIAAADGDAGTAGSTQRPPKPRSEHLVSLEQQFRSLFGTKVDLKAGAKDKGRIIIHFNNNEEFERLRGQLLAATSPEPAKKAA